MPEPFEIEGAGLDAVGTGSGVLVAFAGPGEARMFRRRGVRMSSKGGGEAIEMLVAELDGIRTTCAANLSVGNIGVYRRPCSNAPV